MTEASEANQPTPTRRFIALTVLFALGALCVMPWDVPLALWCKEVDLPGDIRRLINYSEVFGHGIGVSLIIITAARLDPRRWRILIVLAIYGLGSGLIADFVKLFVGRHRPYDFDLEACRSSWETWIGWLPWLNGVPLEYDNISFPSAHTATAVGLAFGLTRLYPKGRVLFGLFACLAGAQRLFERAHFASDVLFAVAVSCLFCAALSRPWSIPSRLLKTGDTAP